MSRARVLLRGLVQKTVWSEVNTHKIPERYLHIYTRVLPEKYAAIFLYGLLSIAVKVTSIDLVFGTVYGDAWSLVLTAAGAMAVIGISFYARLIWFELVADIILVTLMVFYIFCIFIAAFTRVEEFRYLSLLLVFIFLPMPAWRVADIVKELRPPRVV